MVTDPPYYDNVPYADISDFFYVWLKRTVGHLYPEHFASDWHSQEKEAIAERRRVTAATRRRQSKPTKT